MGTTRSTDTGTEDQYEITIDQLDEETCWRLLARTRFGRLGFVVEGELSILPVNAVATRRRVVFRTAQDTTLASIPPGSAVAFESDHTDPVAESGWSVLVRGTLRDATGSPDVASWQELDVRPWAPPPRDRWMLLEPTGVTGRVVYRRRVLAPGTHVPYMPPG